MDGIQLAWGSFGSTFTLAWLAFDLDLVLATVSVEVSDMGLREGASEACAGDVPAINTRISPKNFGTLFDTKACTNGSKITPFNVIIPNLSKLLA